MIKTRLAAIAALLLAGAASAQVQMPAVKGINGLKEGATGVVCINQDGTACNFGQGVVAAGATGNPNPVAVGGRYVASPAIVPNDSINVFRTDNYGTLATRLLGPGGGFIDVLSGTVSDSQTNTVTVLSMVNRNLVFNGSTWDRQRGDTSGTYTVNAPSAAANNAIAPVTALGATSLVVKGGAGNFYGASITAGSVAGFLVVLNAVAAPSSGASLAAASVAHCVPVAANGYATTSSDAMPDRLSAGSTVLFSTSCSTYTPVGTAALHIRGRAM